jgi:AraC-like DNA-binding protein
MTKDMPIYSAYFWGGHILYLGRLDCAEHAHHALQLIMNRTGKFELRIDGSSIECGGAIIRPDCRHQLLTSSDTQVHLLIDRHNAVARAIAGKHLGKKNFKILTGALLKRLQGCIDVPANYLRSCEHAHDVYKKLVSELGGFNEHEEENIDPRIKAVMDLLQEKLLCEKVTIKELTRRAGLSESRLMHLFTEQIGIPLRRYNLWLRIIAAERYVAQGKMSLTEAAHSAGFADSAHLCRTYKSMFGHHLSDCVKNSRFVQVNSCYSW